MTIFRDSRLVQNLTLAEVSKRSKINICKLSYAERGLLPLTKPEYKRLAKILRLPARKKQIIKTIEENQEEEWKI